MRNILLTGVALGVVVALAAAGTARADEPAAVFPVTSETDLAGWNGPSLNGAAPGSVQVNLGGRTFSAIWFGSNPSGTPNWAHSAEPQFMSYFFLYPGFDYASPGGVHFGAQAEIRMTSSPQGGGSGGNDNSPIPWFHQAYTYVSSPVFGKFQFGLANSALDELGVGNADDFGTGVFFGWYSTDPYVPWVMSDGYDGNITQQKFVYTTPTIAGFKAAVSFQPTAVSANYADDLTVGEAPGFTGLIGPGDSALSAGLLSRNRVTIAANYATTLGAFGVKVGGGFVWAEAEKSGDATIGQNVTLGNVGAKITFAGFEIEGQGQTGKWNMNLADNGNPQGPLPAGAKGSTAYDAGIGYSMGPFKVGAVYYGANYDLADFGGQLGKTGRLSGEGIGGSYTVGPGVVAYLDAYRADFDDPAVGNGKVRQYPSGIGVGTFFTW